MRRTISMSAIGLSLCAGLAAASEPATFYLHVLHNNDGESDLINAGSGLEDFGGIARFATVIENLRAEIATIPNNATPRGGVLISSGDNFLAGPEFNASLANGVPFFDTIGLDLIGYDAFTIGNHEFDFGPDILADFIDGILVSGPYLSANLSYENEPGLQSLFDAGKIARSTIVTAGGQQIGIIGATTPDLRFISSPRDTTVGSDVAAAVQAEVDALTLAGVNKIILASHLQSVTEELALADLVTGVDVIIAGGGDELLANPGDLLVPGDSPATLPDGQSGYPVFSSGGTPIVTTAGGYRYAGRLIVGFDDAGNVTEVLTESGPVRVSGTGEDAVVADPVVQAEVVDPVAASVADLAANVIGNSDVPLDGVRGNVRTRETNLGNLIADSLLRAATDLAPTFGTPVPDLALQNGGGIRNDSLIPAGDVTELDTFQILPFGNFVTTVEGISPAQLKEILENAVSRVESVNGRFAQVSGLKFYYTLSGTAQELDNDGNVAVPGTRVQEVVLNDGRVIVAGGEVVEGAATLNVATINFLATGGDQYPFRGAPFTRLGLTYQQALAGYIENTLEGQVSSVAYPDGGEGRIIQLPGVCAADLAQPFGSLDFFDVQLFLQAFSDGDPVADLAAPFGTFDFHDIQALLDRFTSGCP